MRADEWSRELAQRLANRFTVVAQPDHPLLLDGPDLLIATELGPVAGFVLKVAERRSSEDLLVRLATSRLAMPTTTRCVLLVPSDVEERDLPLRADADFDAVLEVDDLRGLKRLLEAVRHERRFTGTPPDVKAKAFERFHILLDETRKLQERNQRRGLERPSGETDSESTAQALTEYAGFERARIRRWDWRLGGEETRPHRSPVLLRFGDTLAGTLGEDRRGSILPRLRAACKDVVQTEFDLDNGVPYRVEPTANLLLVDRLPEGRLDPAKPVRAAAFAGWSMLERADVDLTLAHAERLHEIAMRRSL